MKKFLTALAVVLTCFLSIPSQASFCSGASFCGFGGFFGGGVVATFSNTMTTAEYIWEADTGTTIETGVKFWDDQVSSFTQDKLNTAEQPTLTTSANFNNQSVLDFNSGATQGMDGSSATDLTGNDQMTIFLVVESDSASATTYLAEVSNGTAANSVCQIVTISSGQIRARCRNSSNAWISADWTTSTNFSATTLALIYDGTGGAGDISLYECNTERANATDATGGINTTSNRIWTMQAANDLFHADGKVGAYLVDDDAWTTDQLANAVTISQSKYGVCN